MRTVEALLPFLASLALEPEQKALDAVSAIAAVLLLLRVGDEVKQVLTQSWGLQNGQCAYMMEINVLLGFWPGSKRSVKQGNGAKGRCFICTH